MARRIITTESLEEDNKIENSLRPQFLRDYIGQEKAKKTLKIYIEAAKARGGGAGPRPLLRAARPWQDDPGGDHCK